MSELIITRPDKCVGCNSCVRSCPAPEANITKMLEGGKFVTTVNPDRCIGCGSCVKSCNHGARDYIDDTEECMTRMKREKIIILADPSIKTGFPTKWKGILDWFRKQGCMIYDASFGADICTWAHLRAIEQKKVGNIITQPCAAIVKYVETYQPKLLANLSPIHSPVSCSAVYIKKYLNRNNPIAVLSSCIAKKFEAEETGLIDFNVTFKKLNDYFERNGITIPVSSTEDYEYKFDDQQGQVGAIYSRPGGLRDNIWLHNQDINITTSEGAQKVFPELDMYAEMPDFKHPEIFDVLSCEFGCNLGPGASTNQTMFDVMLTMKEVENEAKSRRKSGFMGRGDDKMLKKFDDELKLNDFLRNYKPVTPTPVPTERQLDPIYESMGKHTEDDKKYDCHACGHRSCRDMAIAIYRGLNTPDNCVVHAKTVMVARHSELAEQHEKLAEITYECLELSDKLKADVDNILKNMETIGDSTAKTSERADVVRNLLTNVVAFCNDNPTMDSGSVSQLINILETTIDAFSALDDNVNVTNESSGLINNSIGEITRLVEEINNTLHKASEKKS
ncbi:MULTISPECIES: [Fe-Fe] hydrogenase large subunit C-terminal domain-containing protein [Ruminococcus]|uniref:Fe-S cluster domain protein n=1 Tax=Ruminococcus albus (strain ATCC 27210 / DSM 20455 / JCM 14654 / NCDO 2250 / 7) TaxID=697329 RepID=E6UGT9_RUMA7|nr:MULTISPECIES: [Fe-Fe] hydrogenase large subunit C-terminal domain-containing protein [Ruminococcus]ADU21126.1 Fe-S cluster domain protein [Ruminococcus albus 7 = DSM 20455]MCR5020751.1 4Fe-4S binding protein [Ruminococcus sp.]